MVAPLAVLQAILRIRLKYASFDGGSPFLRCHRGLPRRLAWIDGAGRECGALSSLCRCDDHDEVADAHSRGFPGRHRSQPHLFAERGATCALGTETPGSRSSALLDGAARTPWVPLSGTSARSANGTDHGSRSVTPPADLRAWPPVSRARYGDEMRTFAPANPVRSRARLQVALLILSGTVALFCAGLATGSVTTAQAGSSVKKCHRFTISKGLRAWNVRRSAKISCRTTRRLLRGAYGAGSIATTYEQRTDEGVPFGRPTYWLRGGWRCTNGAGGAACWSESNPTYNAIANPGFQNMAADASTG